MKSTFHFEKQNNNQHELETCLDVFQTILKSRTGRSLYTDEPDLYNTITQTVNILEYRLQEITTLNK